MERDRSRFLDGLKARLNQDRAACDRPDAAPEPSSNGGQTATGGDPEVSATTAEGLAASETGTATADQAERPVAKTNTVTAGGQRRCAEATPDPAIPPSGQPATTSPGGDAGVASEPDHPATPWSESGMPQRTREAIASVRRISSDQATPADDRAPEQAVLGQLLEHGAPARSSATERPNVHTAAFVVASALVLLVGFGVGFLLEGRDPGEPWLPASTAAAPPAQSNLPAAEGMAPAIDETPPPITETITVRRPPSPAPAFELPPDPAATGALPLPPPPKPASQSTVSAEEGGTTDRTDGVVDATVDALRDMLEAGGSGGPFEPEDALPPSPRVSVNYTTNDVGGPATAMHLVRYLKAAGFEVESRAVDVAVPASSVRYFFAADRDDAEALSSSLEGQVPGGAAPPVLDFTRYQPKPPKGHLEIWIRA